MSCIAACLQTAGAQTPCSANPDKIICDNFETYTLGNVSPQAVHWRPWSGAETGILSSKVVTDQASDGTQSMKVEYEISGTTQGDDQLLLLGNKTTGRYSLKWKMYIAPGRSAYYNIQNSETAGQQWNLDIFFDFNANARLIVKPSTQNQNFNRGFSYPQGKWFTLEHVIDLDNNLARLYVDNKFIYGWDYADNLGSIDFYSASTNDIFYVDEVEYVKLPSLTYDADICGSAIDLSPYFNRVTNVPQTTGLYDNTNATTSATDPQNITCLGEDIDGDKDAINTSMWYTFPGDGNKYDIQTVPCNATNYIGLDQGNLGDTQMLLFAGNDCSNLTQIDCNDDLNPPLPGGGGGPDFRAGLTLQTEQDKNYYLMVDGFEFQNTVAKGEFCIQVTRTDCPLAAIGAATSDEFVCFGDTMKISLDVANTIIPTQGTYYGMCWAINTQPVPAGAWPVTAPGYIGSFFLNAFAYTPGLPNNSSAGTLLAGAAYYFTPVIVSNAVKINANTTTSLADLEEPASCFFTSGPSVLAYFAPEFLFPLDGVASVTLPTGGQQNGSIDLTVGGGLGEYLDDPSFYGFKWSTGPMTEDLENIGFGTYTVTVTDPSGCSDPFVLTVGVTGLKDPEAVRSMSLSPNPTTGTALLRLDLENTADVRLELLNTLGQSLQIFHVGKVNNLTHTLQLEGLANGAYFLRVTIEGETAVRRIVLQR